MATVIDSLFISLGVDPKGVTEGMNKAESTIQSSLKNIASFIAPLLGAVRFGAITKQYLATADALEKFSDSIGENIEESMHGVKLLFVLVVVQVDSRLPCIV